MSRIRFIFAASLVSMLSAGCGRTTPIVLGQDHPASPEAAAAPLPPPSPTLAVAAPPSAPEVGDGAGGGMDHSGHGAASGPATGPSTPSTQPATEGSYVCPMHPEVTSDDPEARCPKCRMRLVPKEDDQ